LVPRFDYDEALDALQADPPAWPSPTRDVGEIRLALRYKPTQGAKKLLSKASTLYLDIVDYPGEWLLDLPLLSLSFEQWSTLQFQQLTGTRASLAADWLSQLNRLDPSHEADEQKVAELSAIYTSYLHRCKNEGLHWVQPGRFVLPGELAGAPVLQFFPYRLNAQQKIAQKGMKGSLYQMLEARYNQYQQRVVKRFYKEYFSTFDRQIVLVDCLQPLNAGAESFEDMKGALSQIMKSFRYGNASFLKRLFSPRIDKLLFAATKADHVTPDQHANLVSLLQQLINPVWQHAAFENIEMACFAISSIQATTAGFVTPSQPSATKQSVPAIQGTTLDGQPLTLYPGEVPQKLPDADYWKESQFDFVGFRPRRNGEEDPLAHVRVDKVLQYLIGDKLK
jgi:predicted YcjX-like family ATPase